MKTLYVILCCLFLKFCFAQNQKQEAFQKISSKIKDFKVNTSAVPEDQLTLEIRKLRDTKGGFNINEAILFKIGEDKSKGDLTEVEADKLEKFFTQGNGKISLDNAIIWMYRDLFTRSDIKKMIRFYKTSAGQKLSENFPLMMLESLKAAEEIMKDYKKTD